MHAQLSHDQAPLVALKVLYYIHAELWRQGESIRTGYLSIYQSDPDSSCMRTVPKDDTTKIDRLV
ncbi:hypothetical protein BPAE_0101g00140 [Botrytis paeoniae]|uniref:Uncharacterized protein n=1 Tax=Botrytis paeoniae TaxID=278948 RepID=A0A4Z1FIK7_9HELO|nr:hypothetical protein BPAE_0101g00140 [Botrytis paeoniae]